MPSPSLEGSLRPSHHVNQADHRANDTHGRRVAAGRFPDAGGLAFLQFERVDFDFHDFTQATRLGSVDEQFHRPLDERIGDDFHLRFEREQAVAPHRLCPKYDAADQAACLGLRRAEYQRTLRTPRVKTLAGCCSNTAASVPPSTINKAAGWQEQAELAAFDEVPAQQGHQAQGEPDQAAGIDDFSRSQVRRRETARLCNWLDAGNAHPHDLADFLQVEFLFVIQRHQELLALRQNIDGLDQTHLEVGIQQVFQRNR